MSIIHRFSVCLGPGGYGVRKDSSLPIPIHHKSNLITNFHYVAFGRIHRPQTLTTAAAQFPWKDGGISIKLSLTNYGDIKFLNPDEVVGELEEFAKTLRSKVTAVSDKKYI